MMFDPTEKGLLKVLRDYQEEALRFVWDSDEGVTSRKVWIYVNDVLKGERTVSRASIINFLNRMVEEDVLNSREESGKGGYHAIYTPKMDETEFIKHIVRTVNESLMRDFPEESREVLKEF